MIHVGTLRVIPDDNLITRWMRDAVADGVEFKHVGWEGGTPDDPKYMVVQVWVAMKEGI